MASASQAAQRAAAFGGAILMVAVIALSVNRDRPSATAMMESSLPAGWPGVPVAQPDIAELVAAVEPRTTKLVEEGNCRWTYAGTSGPANWGEMCEKKFATCGTGKMQSPIDVSSYDVIAYTERFLNVARWKQETLSWKIPPAAIDSFARVEPAATELYNGYSYVVEHVNAALTFSGTQYTLKYLTMHTVSEHTFEGGHYDLEMQFVHTAPAPDGTEKVLIVACFYQAVEGTSSPQYFKDLANAGPALTSAPRSIVPLNFKDMAQQVLVGSVSTDGTQAADFQPNFINYLAYTGSLTTPPCTENVQWILLRNPVLVAPEDVAKVKNLEGSNWRPAQPLNGRSVYWLNKPAV